MKLRYFIIPLLILLSLKSYGQGSKEKPRRTAVESALLDSAGRYEKLKVANFHLEIAYEYQSKEIADLRLAIKVLEMQNESERRVYEDKIRHEREKGNKKGKIGFVSGFVAGFILGIKI